MLILSVKKLTKRSEIIKYDEERYTLFCLWLVKYIILLESKSVEVDIPDNHKRSKYATISNTEFKSVLKIKAEYANEKIWTT